MIVPNYDKWAMWIGENVRNSQDVFNTESRKYRVGESATSSDINECVPDEVIADLQNEKVSF